MENKGRRKNGTFTKGHKIGKNNKRGPSKFTNLKQASLKVFERLIKWFSFNELVFLVRPMKMKVCSMNNQRIVISYRTL